MRVLSYASFICRASVGCSPDIHSRGKSNEKELAIKSFTAIERQNFLKRAGIAGLGIAAAGLLVGGGARAFASERLTIHAIGAAERL